MSDTLSNIYNFSDSQTKLTILLAIDEDNVITNQEQS